MSYFTRTQKSAPNLAKRATSLIVAISKVNKRVQMIVKGARKQKPTSSYGKSSQKAVMRRALELESALNKCGLQARTLAAHVDDLLTD